MAVSKKLVFFGNERLATAVKTTAPTLRVLIDAGWQVCAVVSNFRPAVSRSERELEIATVARAHNIPLLLPEKVADIAHELRQFGAECGVLVAYGQIVPQSIIDIFPAGIINIHPSLLPHYRGPTPVETAILDGATETGVSLMALAAKMDAGPVYAQQALSLSGGETKQELADKLLGIGTQMLIDNLPAIIDGKMRATEQNEAEATYTKLLKKDDGVVNWQEPAEVVERKIRAYAGYPKSRTEVHDKEIIITKARVAESGEDGQLVMQCNPGWLEIIELIAPSGRTVSGADFLRGLRG
jgi:methionyl-tRNA formyltransferase